MILHFQPLLHAESFTRRALSACLHHPDNRMETICTAVVDRFLDHVTDATAW